MRMSMYNIHNQLLFGKTSTLSFTMISMIIIYNGLNNACICCSGVPYIAGNFRGTNYSWVIFSWLELALQVKVSKVASFVGKIFVVRHSNKNHEYLPHENYHLYGIC